MKVQDIVALGACPLAVDWLKANRRKGVKRLWAECPHGDWLLWLYGRTKNMDRRFLVRAAAECARLALRHVPVGEDRPRLAIEAALLCATIPSPRTAGAAADAAQAAWAAGAAWAARAADAGSAWDAAGSAAEAAHAAWAAAGSAAHAAWAASDAAAGAAGTAGAAGAAGAAAWAAWAAARSAGSAAEDAKAVEHAKCADIVRGIIPFELYV